jgi:hypothetical protein
LFHCLKRRAVYFAPDGHINTYRYSWKVGYENFSNSIINLSCSTNYSRTRGYEKSLWLFIEVFQDHTWKTGQSDFNRRSAGFKKKRKIWVPTARKTHLLSTVQFQMFNVVNGIIHRPSFLCCLLVRSPGEQDGSSRAELLSDYKNGYYFFRVIPIETIEKI